MVFSPSIMILQFSILLVFITSKSLFLALETPKLSLLTDKEALISFKSGTNLDTLDPPFNWDQTLSPCNWTGVLCNKVGTRVVKLKLVGLGLTGSISPHIGNLSFLKSLELQDNQLMGTFPNQLGNLFRLRVLNMSSNNIQGAILQNISHCMELEILDLEHNGISGRIPTELSYLTKLQVLNLGRNLLFGSIPPSLANLSSLMSLNLGTNTLDGTIPGDLSRLQKLERLVLTINNLTATVPPSIYNMSTLVFLNLAGNGLSGRIPSNVGETLPNLLVAKFCVNKFTGTIPVTLHNLTRIQSIRLGENFLHGTVPPGLGNLPELQSYQIRFNRIVSFGDNGLDFVTRLTNSTRLEHLSFDENLLEGVIPESIGNLSKVLSRLYMGGNRIYGRIPASIGHLSGLTLLNLSYNSISYDIPPEIGQLENLLSLGLAGNHLSGKIPTSLGSLKNLINVDLSGNKLEGTIPSSFENFQRLLSVDLSCNKLNGSIPKEILNIRSLSSHMNLSNNLLTGPLPQEIGTLGSVVTIDLSDNGLSETIPNSIGKCKSLEKLLMANNMFTGPIPNTLSELKGLETLDISSNKLSGPIPNSLQELKGLQLLNLSFNDLEGEVPIGGVFTDLSRTYLHGNPKLCFMLACEKRRAHRKRLILVCTIVVSIAIIASFSTIGFAFYLKKRKPEVIASSSFDSFERRHQMVSYDELRLATENFNPRNLIGSGNFGSVYKGYLQPEKPVAVKVLNVDWTRSWKSFLAECAALRNVSHRNLVKLITSCSSMDFRNINFLALVYELMTNGSLEDWITGRRSHANGQGLSILDRLNVAIDVASVLDYLHRENGTQVIVHCDLKPSNILLDGDMTAKVGDFGLAKLLINRADQASISSTDALKGSIGYIPPEYGIGQKLSTAGDVYSYGITLLELFTGRSPIHESFTGDLSLKKWVQMAVATNADQVLDPSLVPPNSSDVQSITSEAQSDCLIAVLGVGLACTANSPDGRISMRDALCKLKSIRETLLKT